MHAFSKQHCSYGALPFGLFLRHFFCLRSEPTVGITRFFRIEDGQLFPLQLSNELLHITHKVWLSPPLSLKGLLCFSEETAGKLRHLFIWLLECNCLAL